MAEAEYERMGDTERKKVRWEPDLAVMVQLVEAEAAFTASFDAANKCSPGGVDGESPDATLFTSL